MSSRRINHDCLINSLSSENQNQVLSNKQFNYKSTLYHWKITEDNLYFLCRHKQTQLHLLSNFEKCLNRYTQRHDSLLNTLLQQFSKILKTSSKIYCDSNKLQYNTTLQLFTEQCPDIAILDRDEMTVIELTICFETNTLKSRKYKIK